MKRTNEYTAIGKDTPEVCIWLWQAIAEREAAKIKRRRKWLRLLAILTFWKKPQTDTTVCEWTDKGYVSRKETP